MTSYMDYTAPGVQFTADVNKSNLFTKDNQNFINVLSIQQLNTLENTSLLDIYLSKSNVVEPHYHQNAAELVYCISGAAVVSLINPFTNELLDFPITPGQVANVPQGWWHYEVATVDNTHLLAIFDAPIPEVILGSDILKITPPKVLAHTYCLDEAKLKEVLAPIQKRTFIGPPVGCVQGAVKGKTENAGPPHHYAPMPQPYTSPQHGYVQPAPYHSAPQPYGYQQYATPVYTNQVYGQSYLQQPYVQPRPTVQYGSAPESI